MARSEVDMAATPEDVFATLLDPWSYQHWVVGSKAIREVDEGWPQTGAAFHHRAGLGPLEVWDRTRVVAVDPPRTIALDARVWPTGEHRVVLQVAPSETGCTVVMLESPLRGPAAIIDNPLLHVVTRIRNELALRRLRKVVEQRTAMAVQGPTA
jgi:uncharacterized protein YndB with AHSA1/START domain